jgi:murein DD-endopeptidase MepM/ murein hydrolase activator NlpD
MKKASPCAGIALAVALGIAVPAVAAGPHCRDNWICIDEETDGDRISLRARNLREYPLTFTLTVRSRSHTIEGDERVTATLLPHESRRTVIMHERSGTGRYRYSLDLDWTVGVMDANHDDDHLYAFPYRQGRTYPVLQGYGSRFSHRGREEFAVDFDMPEGTPVHAARGGVIARVVESNDRGCWEDGCGRYANFIVVLHSDGTTGEYYHLKKHGALVEEGESVARGQRIGLSGNTGHTAMPHLHFAVYHATEGGQTQSIPVRFQSADGVVAVPRRGARHQASY